MYLSRRLASSKFTAGVGGLGARGHGTGDCRVIIISPKELTRLSMNCRI